MDESASKLCQLILNKLYHQKTKLTANLPANQFPTTAKINFEHKIETSYEAFEKCLTYQMQLPVILILNKKSHSCIALQSLFTICVILSRVMEIIIV